MGTIKNIDWNNTKCFKTWNYRHMHEDVGNLIIDAIAVLIGEYEAYRKQAAMLILKTLLKDNFLDHILKDYDGIYPYDRKDNRVMAWKKEVLAVGYCQRCGSTEILEAHHIVKWSELPSGRIDPKNGECLCVECHAKEHESDGLSHLILSKAKKVRTC